MSDSDLAIQHLSLVRADSGCDVPLQNTVVTVGRPEGSRYFQIHPSPDMRIEVATIKAPHESGPYLLTDEMQVVLQRVSKRMLLYAGITSLREKFLWPLSLPVDGNRWTLSAAEIIQIAQTKWIRMEQNTEGTGWQGYLPSRVRAAPDYGTQTLQEWITAAFRDRVISNEKHPLAEYYILGPGLE